MSSGTPPRMATMMYEKKRPRVIEVVLRRPRGMVGMRMVEAEELGPALRGAPLRGAIVVRADPEPPARPFIGHVRQRERAQDDALAANERAAALVRIGFTAVTFDRRGNAGIQTQAHDRRSPCDDSSQKRSDRYFSPPSQKTTTITA